MRLGFLIVPPDLRQAMGAARLATDIHPAVPEQAVLADFMTGGTSSVICGECGPNIAQGWMRLPKPRHGTGDGLLRLRPVTAGLHVARRSGEVDADDAVVFHEAMARGVEVMPLSTFCFDRRSPPVRGLMLGFAAIRPGAVRCRHGAAGRRDAEAARRKPRSGRIRSS